LLTAVETVADDSKTLARPDAFFSNHSKSAAETFGPTTVSPVPFNSRASEPCLPPVERKAIALASRRFTRRACLSFWPCARRREVRSYFAVHRFLGLRMILN